MTWIIEPEYIACILLATMIIYSFLWNRSPAGVDRYFRGTLLLTLVAILSNIVGTDCIQMAAVLSRPLNMWINSIYFGLSYMMMEAITGYVLLRIFDGQYHQPLFRGAVIAVLCALAAALALVFVNLGTGCLFAFDENFVYVRGALNTSPFMLLMADVVIVSVCYLARRKVLRSAFRYVFWIVIVLAGVLASVQLVSPNTMLSGSAAALVLLVMFIFGQQERLHVDSLTELNNREMFYTTLERYAGKGRRFYTVMVSLRGFKNVNSVLGQRVGDDLVRQVGLFLGSLDKNVSVYRFSGVEFALLLTDISDYDYHAVFDKVYTRFQSPWETHGTSLMLNAAIADIAYPEYASTSNSLIASLEYAVRLAKDTGEPIHFDKKLRSVYGRQNYVTGLLEPAIREDRYFFMFQPIIDCHTGMPQGVEVLLRLRDATGQVIMPGEFIPLAEKVGLISRINWMVMENAIRFFASHADCGIDWFSVNVSGDGYESDETVRRLRELLQKYGLPQNMLKLELTERMIIKKMDIARETMFQLQAEGIGVFLDDFGTGYSNLASAIGLPLEYIKIDKSLVENVNTDSYAYSMLKNLIKGLKAIGIQVLAEGVETAEQNAIVKQMQVDKIQGFYYSKPLNEEEFLGYMNSFIRG